ncbi:MAG: F0F1 ATP synthase subunit A [Anaerolineae bacterium]|nr:F0F1 ATP synthase subunit A [Anaerolineae bacterium]
MGIEPHQVFTLFDGRIVITNTVTSTWMMMLLIIALARFLLQRYPTALEMLIDFFTDLVADVVGEETARLYMPFLGALAIFIAFANLIGVIPGFVSPTRDINTSAALAVIVFFAVHYFGINAKGWLNYLKDLASPLYLLPLTLPLELIGQFSRTLSLTLRLFGNILSGEMVVAVIFSLVPLFVQLPLQGLSMFTGLLQAYIFTVLATVYIGAGIEANQA